jgi:hypothetical protein
MKSSSITALAGLVLAACATPRTTAPAPGPAPAPATVASPVTSGNIPRSSRAKAPAEWQLLDEAGDSLPGMGVLRAERELLAGMQPRQTVLVAVIDGGVDTAQTDLVPHLWRNPKEVPGNGKDDDHNGYVDDTWGWNFIGGRDGRDIDHETLEVTRLFARCENIAPLSVGGPDPSPQLCDTVTADYEKKRAEDTQTLDNINGAARAQDRALQILHAAIPDSLTPQRVQNFHPTDAQQVQARAVFLQLAGSGLTPDVVAQAQKEYESRVRYGYDSTYNPRGIVGDDPANLTQRDYGNRDVMGPDALHGTHVSGIIGATPDAADSVRGIAQSVRIMMVRTIPDGDERDKDVANAIRYAVDNGARVINMSFGKPYSPQKSVVDDAVKYADAHGVLMVHAAGNDNRDIDAGGNFPTAVYLDGGMARNWIEVGATSWKGGAALVASFSNYGQKRVDVFAPGEDILSTIPGNKYERDSGTSMAAPMVTGLAALMLSYYPDLTAADVKRIILQSASRYPSQMVTKPGAGADAALVPFGTLSATGGIVNAYAALRMAGSQSAGNQ